MNETEMREHRVPWLKSADELTAYIESLITQQRDYGTAAYAMSLAAVAAFQYVAGKVGASGFQASCADLDVVRRTRHLNGPFILLKGEDMLYPQYDLHGKLQEAMDSWREWAREEARKKLAAHKAETAHPDVIKHWKMLAGEQP